MAAISLPEGRYLTCAIDIHPDYGGQTRALLMRNRIFAAWAGIRPAVLTFGPARDIPERKQGLAERRLVTPDMDLLNLYEQHRDTDWPGEEPTGELEDLRRHLKKEDADSSGLPWRRVYDLEGSMVLDYLRPDGTTWIRVPHFAHKVEATWPTRVQRVARTGEVVGEWKGMSGWYRQWIRQLSAGHERSFVFIDTRFLAPFIVPMKAPNVHLIYLLHNIHIGDERRWDSRVGEIYERLLGHLGDFDAFVTLTQRQRQDIAERFGARNNMFVVPNPVDLPEAPDVVERDPRLVSVVARLEGQKRLSHTVHAFGHVLKKVPDARLDIYGAGSRRDTIQRIIDKKGLSGSITMKGHDPHAREALWRSSGFLMTSMFEGYPLSTLESMSHGCPVVSYDIKYGPREQIEDGVDGFLVPDADFRALGDRLVQLLEDPALVEKMSAAARSKAAQHGYDRFVSEWAGVVQAAADLKRRRVHLDQVELEVTRLTTGAGTPVAGARVSGPGELRANRRLRFEGRLTVTGRSRASSLADAVVTLAAVHESSGAVVQVPVKVRRKGDQLRLRATAALGDLYAEGVDPSGRTHLRLRLVWGNAAWETVVRRPRGTSGIEVSYAGDGALELTRF